MGKKYSIILVVVSVILIGLTLFIAINNLPEEPEWIFGEIVVEHPDGWEEFDETHRELLIGPWEHNGGSQFHITYTFGEDGIFESRQHLNQEPVEAFPDIVTVGTWELQHTILTITTPDISSEEYQYHTLGWQIEIDEDVLVLEDYFRTGVSRVFIRPQ